METKIKTYTPKPIPVRAIQYDGSTEMAMELENMNIGLYISCDSNDTFKELRGYTRSGAPNGTSRPVVKGDTLVQYYPLGIYYLVDKDEFERTYEEVKGETK